MLKEVVLSVKGPNLFQELARKYSCRLEMVDCKSFNSHGMSLLFRVGGEQSEALLNELKSRSDVKRAYVAERRGDKSLVMVIMEAPVYCNVAQNSGAFCVTCPFRESSGREGEGARWKLLVRDAGVLSKTVSMLEEMGVNAEIGSVSDPTRGDVLTPRQREVVLAAVRLGYFDFPRKKDLTQLASELSVRPSTLSEIMRRAESKMARYYFESIRP